MRKTDHNETLKWLLFILHSFMRDVLAFVFVDESGQSENNATHYHRNLVKRTSLGLLSAEQCARLKYC